MALICKWVDLLAYGLDLIWTSLKVGILLCQQLYELMQHY